MPPPPPSRQWKIQRPSRARVKAATAKLGDFSNCSIAVLWCHLVKIIMVAPCALFERHVWSFSRQRHTLLKTLLEGSFVLQIATK